MFTAIQSPFLQRFVPLLAKVLNFSNITVLSLATLLYLLAWSVTASHTADNPQWQGHAVTVDEAKGKQLNKSQLVYIKQGFGAGAIVTDQQGLVKNRLSNNDLTLFQGLQFGLTGLLLINALIAAILLTSNNYLRLVLATGALIVINVQLDVMVLFSPAQDVFIDPISAVIVLGVGALCYVLSLGFLLKNNHISDTLIAYASQSGSAMSLAKRFKKAISHTADVRCLSSLAPQALSQYNEVLIIASTYGEGQPPEKVNGFVSKLDAFEGYQQPVRYSILALGDSQYPHFCAFGHQLDTLLNSKGAQSVFNLIEVDKLDLKAVNTWWQGLTRVLNWQTAVVKNDCKDLTLLSNTCLNPGQAHRKAHSLCIEKKNLDYRAGDLLEVTAKRSIEQSRAIVQKLGFAEQQKVKVNERQLPLVEALCELEWQGQTSLDPQNLVDQLGPITPRVYSISSSPQQEHIEIFVRRHVRDDGTEGLASSYLCDLRPEQTMQANIRVHSNFHLPNENTPLILIGAGTGIAPLIGFLRQRAFDASTEQHWLFFGEQHKQSDFYFATELEQFQQQGLLSRMNLAWSRDDNSSYIGEHIEREREDLLHWIENLNASVYICGNRAGFGNSVCSVLVEILGQTQYDLMIEQRRLRTDLY